MPTNQAFDGGELRKLELPYDTASFPLSPDVRLTGGSNMLVNRFGQLQKRPACLANGMGIFQNAGVNNFFIVNTVNYETLDNPPKRFIAVSVGINTTFASTTSYDFLVGNLSTGGFSLSSDLRRMRFSRHPHEFVVSRGLLFIRGTPTSADDNGSPDGQKTETIIFNGSSNTFTFWGLTGPTAPAAMQFPTANWTASTFPVTVSTGWSYVYTYKTITGHESNRSPLQTNQSLPASDTGAFTNRCPRMTLTGHADTTQVPTIVIYRSTDGGGTFYRIEEISNPGAGTFTYDDRHFPDGTATPAQPFPDSALDTISIAPTLTSNSPPPTVAARDQAITQLNGAINNVVTTITVDTTYNGQPFNFQTLSAELTFNFVVTVDSEQMLVFATPSPSTATVARGINGTVTAAHNDNAPVRLTPIVGYNSPQQSTALAAYAGRLWYAIGHVLFYSGNEEVTTGVPEECWPSGSRGNFYRFNQPIVNVASTSEALYVICTEETYWLRGSTKDTFQIQKLFADLGGRSGQNRAIAAADKSLCWLTNDFRIVMARGYKREFLSDDLGNALRDAVLSGHSIFLARYAEADHDFLMVGATRPSDMSMAQQWVFDFNQGETGLWNTPWSLPATAATGGAYNTDGFGGNAQGRYFQIAQARTASGKLAASVGLFDMTGASMSDTTFAGLLPPLDHAASFTVGPVRNPTGNHINVLREPGLTSVLYGVKLDRTAFGGDNDPTLTLFFDNISGSGGTAVGSPQDPPRRVVSVGYDTLWYMLDPPTACERVTTQFSKPANSERWENQCLAWIWTPNSGA